MLVGYGASNLLGDMMNAGWKFNAQTRRLLTFRLGGMAKLPASAPQDYGTHPVDDPSIKIDPADVAPGGVQYTLNCSNCHGAAAASAGAPAPDLRESSIAMDRDALWHVLHD